MTTDDGLPDDLTTPEASAVVRRQEMIKELKDDISRGLYSNRHLRTKYGKHFDADELRLIVDGLIQTIASENVIDIRMEIIGYLLSSDDFQDTLYRMMKQEAAAGRTRNVVEIIKLIKDLKNDRLQFIEEIGIPIALYQEGKKISDPQKVNLSALLEAGQRTLEHARLKDSGEYAGKLANGREGDVAGELEGKQIPVHSAGNVSGQTAPSVS